jgi:hypothetical protein
MMTMRNHRDAMLSAVLGFALTSAALVPPILSNNAEKATRIAQYNAALSGEAVRFGRERQARLTYLLRHADEAEFDPLDRQR